MPRTTVLERTVARATPAPESLFLYRVLRGPVRRVLDRFFDFRVNGRLEPGLPGVGLLALRSGAPVVPAGIHGTYAALVGRRGYVPRRHPLAVTFGPPRRFVHEGGRGRPAPRGI